MNRFDETAIAAGATDNGKPGISRILLLTQLIAYSATTDPLEKNVMRAQANAISEELIPVIDLSPLRSGEHPRSVAAALHAASQSLGFIYVEGHGIRPETIAAARAAACRFFESSDEEKAEVLVSPQHRGWLGPGAARMQDDGPVDLKESFIWGYQDAAGHTDCDHPLRGPNQWPAFVPELQAAAMAYYTQAHALAKLLMQGFALGLDLPYDFFLRSCERPISRASFVYYPPQAQTAPPGQFGVGAHTDFGVLTVLCQDDVGGLQVRDVTGNWLIAPPVEGTLVVNVGDLLSRWTDGAYKSTPHRVINSSGRRRLSLVLAFDPDPQTPVDARDVYGAAYQPREEAISCGDYLLQRFARAFPYRDAPGSPAA
ncbi:MAG: isopenicillin N synthase family oxygenase [Granulosicoccus sp.]|nr:isopenicillin N synthase family oxygenase [Granulosicoccus sp.]